jgi:Methane oxygenase PmoA
MGQPTIFGLVPKASICAMAIAMALCNCLSANAGDEAGLQIELTVRAGKHDRRDTPVCVPLDLPAALANAGVRLADADGHDIAAQITERGLIAAKDKLPGASAAQVPRELHFILSRLEPGKVAHLRGALSAPTPKTGTAPAKTDDVFQWHEEPAEQRLLLTYGTRKVLDYVAPRFDDSTSKLREQTYKVFHELYDAAGTRLVTKGAGGNDTHHRGLFYGFNRISYDQGRKHADVWQCLGDAYQSHESVVASAAGAVLGRHCVAIDWHGEGKEVFAHEQRELTAYAVQGGTLIEFVSRLRTAAGPVHLEGDPHHSGFHFRAAQEVAANTKKQTYYLRPDGVGSLDETINWDSTPQDPRTVDQPWKGMCFVLDSRRYTAAILDRPDNPKPAHWSERDYGRFGSTFVYDMITEHPLLVRYRVWLQDGEMTPEGLSRLAADFVEPPTVDLQIR